jgi:hypothetical protein
MQNEIPSQKTEHPSPDSSEVRANDPKRSGGQHETQRGGSSDSQGNNDTRNGDMRNGDMRNGDTRKNERSQPGRQGK